MLLKNNTAKIMIGIAIAFLLFTISSASAATITVNASGVGADYSSIQAAINNANASDVIEVQSGTYLENVVVNKTLSLKGIGMPLINASGSGTAITITSGNSTIDGFNVTGSGTDWNGGDADSGIKIKSDNNSVLNCSVWFNNYGVYVFESENNTIENNSAYSNTEGIYVFYSPNNSIVGNDFVSNINKGVFLSNSNNCSISNNVVLDNNYGIYSTASSKCSLSGNNVTNNDIDGIYLYNSGINTLAYNNVMSNSDGIYLYNSDGNILTDNNVTDNSNYGIYLRYSNGNNLTDNNVISSSYGFRVEYSDGNTLTGNNAMSNSAFGIAVSYSSSNTLTDNSAKNNDNGFSLARTSSNILINNNATSNSLYGIYSSDSDGNTFAGNNATSNVIGIKLYNSDNNILTNSNAKDNSKGIELYNSNSNIFIKNTALNNGYGFYITTSSISNIIFKNNLIENTNYYNAYDTVGSNSWFYNHYSDYTGSDIDGGGIGDTAYYIAGDVGAKDMTPAMQLWDTSGESGLGANFTLRSSINISLYEGYTLTFQQADVVGNKAWITFEKDGIEVDSMVRNVGESFSYTTTINGTNHLIFQGILDTVFQGQTTDLIKITYFYQFSEISGIVLIENSNDLPNPAPTITLSSPSSSFSNTEGDSATFTTTIDQVANVTWILDGITLYTNTSVTTASYYNNSAKTGTHNLTVFAKNTNGTNQKNWTWTVAAPPAPSITLTSPSSSSFTNTEGDSTSFTATVDQVANLTWILDGDTIQTNTSVITTSYYNNSAKAGTHNLTIFAENTNGTDQKKWTWSVNDAPVEETPVLEISYNPGASSISNYINESRIFNVTVSQVANMTWILDGITLYTNTSVTTASYHNSSAQLGTHNLTLLLENANFSESEIWTWTVTTPNTYTMQLQKGWNLVSTPLTPDTPDVNTLFDSNSDVILPIYSWNTANKQYYDVSTIEISKGYWILALNDTQVTFAGTPYSG